MSTSTDTADTADTATASSRRLTIAMLVIATAQLMLVLDDSVANIALDPIGRELEMSASALPWVISAYVLVFGALLLVRAQRLYRTKAQVSRPVLAVRASRGPHARTVRRPPWLCPQHGCH